MTWGFTAVNNQGQVLISSQSKNLHFVGKAGLYSTLRTSNAYGGIRRWAFRIGCKATPMPFFSTPTQDYYGIGAVRKYATDAWEIEVIRSGTSDSIPEIYVFSEALGIPQGAGSVYGLQVRMADGTPAFDSRFSPLAVTGGVVVVPPSNPRLAGPGGLSSDDCRSDASGALAPDSKNIYPINALPGKPIFFYPSIAQANRQVSARRTWQECVGFNAYGSCIGYSENYVKQSNYWAFYRGGIKQMGSEIHCGWVTLEYGCNSRYEYGGALLGIGVKSDSNVGGNWPYSNETLNLMPTSVIMANGARYDTN